MVKAIVTDIEGTTTSVSFVYDVLFPYAREHLPAFIYNHRNEETVINELQSINTEVGKTLSVKEAIAQLIQWMDEDRKATPLKTLQGMVWEEGYKTNGFQGHIYEDVPVNFKKWHEMGMPVYIYSSGSIKAQKLLFSHTPAGDLTPYLSGYFDTTTGNKQESDSYLKIANKIDCSANKILFLSDVIEELDAAMQAGMKTCLLVRDQAKPLSPSPHPIAYNFNEITLNWNQ